jgi:hypothetical protein
MIRPLYNPHGLSCHSCLGSLGDSNPTLTPEAALQKALSAYSGFHLNPKDDYTNPSGMTAQIAAGQFDPYPGCTGQAPNLNVFQTDSGLALGTTSAAVGILGPSGAALIPAAAVPVVGWVIAGVGAITGLISTIFRHHAAAVKRDLDFSCNGLPAVNNAFSLISHAVQNGTMHPADAAAALPQIYSEFMTAGGASGSESGPGSIPGGGTPINDSPWCNSNCELSLALLGMVFYWQSQYEAMAAQQDAAAAAASQSVATSLPTAIDPLTGNPSGISPESGMAIDPVTGHTVFVQTPGSPAPAGSWFTQKTIFPSLPNWAVLAGAFAGLKVARVL